MRRIVLPLRLSILRKEEGEEEEGEEGEQSIIITIVSK